MHTSRYHDLILTVKRMSVRDYVCVCGCPWAYGPLPRKDSLMVDGYTGKWMIERMAKDAPQSLPYPVNADRIYPAGKGKGINKKDDARSDPDFKDGTACLH